MISSTFTIRRAWRSIITILLMLLLPCCVCAQKESIDYNDTTKWFNKTHSIKELTVKGSKSKYSRKNNPAVELMKKVIAAKKLTRLEEHDYYRLKRYQKITLAVNDIRAEDLQNGRINQIPGFFEQIELCPANNKLILPVMVSETVSEKFYRKEPKREREIIRGERNAGINEMMSMGDLLSAVVRDFFCDVNIYDDNIRLFQNRFTSPISDAAIGFYRFYITDTVEVAGDSCIQLRFFPNNQRDFGFTGEIYIINDSSYQVKRSVLSLPNITTVNFVTGMFITQEFTKTEDDTWQLSTDDMIVEMSIYDFLAKGVVIRSSRISGHDYSPFDDERFTESTDFDLRREAQERNEDYWRANRSLELTHAEENMSNFIDNIEQVKGMKLLKFAMNLGMENYLETSATEGKSKFDIGPLLSVLSRNDVDGWRLRIGGRTTANLSPHLFANGYYARGLGSGKDYYKAELTYSFNKKRYLPNEFPRRNITLMSENDVGTPTDRFLTHDKDNMFTAFKWAKVDNMTFYNRQQISFEREEKWNWRTTLTLKTEKTTAAGEMMFARLNRFGTAPTDHSYGHGGAIRTTEARLELRWAPGEKFVDLRRKRRTVNRDAPVFTLSHSVGIDGILGGEYNYNHTEFTAFKRLWLHRIGRLDVHFAAGAQWNQVPFPLLCMPASNLSYFLQRGTFNLVNNMEFLNDRYASLSLELDLGGRLFNRIPLLNELKWREYFGVKTLWGTLSDKNNPTLAENSGSPILMHFPDGCHVMDSQKPYVEVLFGIHNIFKFFHIQYVRRLNYLDLPSAQKHGIRLKFDARF